jgi:hypothetical protein
LPLGLKPDGESKERPAKSNPHESYCMKLSNHFAHWTWHQNIYFCVILK